MKLLSVLLSGDMNCVKTESYIQQHTYQCSASKFIHKYSYISIYGSISVKVLSHPGPVS